MARTLGSKRVGFFAVSIRKALLIAALVLAPPQPLPAPLAAARSGEALLIDGSVPDLRAYGGFEIITGWRSAYRGFFEVAGGQLSWTDGHDIFVGPDFDHGAAVHAVGAPDRWVADETGIYWITERRELWRAGQGRPPTVVWRLSGEPSALSVGPRAVYVVLKPDHAKADPDSPLELWRIGKDRGEATRLSTGSIGRLVVEGDTAYYATTGNRIGRVSGTGGRPDIAATGLPGLVGVDDRYLYGADASHIYRAAKNGGRGIAIAQLENDMVSPIWTRAATDSYAAVGGGYLYWIETNRLYAASVDGGARRVLAALTGRQYRVVPAGESVYVGDLTNGAVYRIPTRDTAVPVEISANSDNASGPAASGARLFWIADGDIKGTQDRLGSPRVIATMPPVGSALVADDRFIYFTSDEGDLWRVPTAGGHPEKTVDMQLLMAKAAIPSRTIEVAPVPPRTVALGPREVFFISRRWGAVVAVRSGAGAPRVLVRDLISPKAPLIDENRLYLLAQGRGARRRPAIVAIERSNGRISEIGPTLIDPTDVGISRKAVYVADLDGRLLRISKDAGEASVVRPPASPRIVALAGRQRSVFFSIGDRILRLDVVASNPRVIASGLASPATSLLVDGNTLYFADTHNLQGQSVGRLFSVALSP
jgi:hypothetical protein